MASIPEYDPAKPLPAGVPHYDRRYNGQVTRINNDVEWRGLTASEAMEKSFADNPTFWPEATKARLRAMAAEADKQPAPPVVDRDQARADLEAQWDRDFPDWRKAP